MSGFKSEPVVDWLEYRLKDELKIMERRHSALLLELRSFLDAPEAPRSRQGSKERSSEMSEERDMDPTTSLTSIPPDLKVAMKVTSPVQEEDSSEDEEEEPQIRTTVLKETLSKQPSSLKEGLGAKQDAKMLIYHPIKLVRSSTFEVFFSALILLQAGAVQVPKPLAHRPCALPWRRNTVALTGVIAWLLRATLKLQGRHGRRCPDSCRPLFLGLIHAGV